MKLLDRVLELIGVVVEAAFFLIGALIIGLVLIGLLSFIFADRAHAGDDFHAPPKAAKEWGALDLTLAGVYVGASAIDAVQTMKAMDQHWPDGSPKFVEKNPLLGSHPSDAAIIGAKVGFGAVVLGAAHFLPEYRTTILIFADVFQVSVVAHNYSIGMKLSY